MPQICSSMIDCISVLEIDQEIKDEVTKALEKEHIKDESNLSNKIVKIIKDVIKSLFEK